MASPDSTSLMDTDGERTRKRRATPYARSGGRTGGGQFQSTGVKDGYGKGIVPMEVRNIFSQANQIVYNTVKQQRYVALDFTGATTNPKIVPYQSIAWWRGINNAANLNYSVQKMINLNAMSFGMRILRAKIVIEVFAVTRQRLIVTGSTNYNTFDFEQGQNLFIAWADRTAETYQVSTPAALDETVMVTGQTTLFGANNDNITKMELPTRERWEHTWDLDVLHHNYLWAPNNLDSVYTLIPGAQGVDVNPALTNTATKEIISGSTTDGSFTYYYNTLQDRRSYPRLMLGQPQIADETGEMKFRYQVRISTELEIEHHLRPDIDNPSLQRQVIPLPSLGGTAANRSVACVPYEAQVNSRDRSRNITHDEHHGFN